MVIEVEQQIPSLRPVLDFIMQELKPLHPELSACEQLVIAYIGSEKMQEMNFQFRGKNYITDILSFEAIEENSLGELVICYDKVKQQAHEHGLIVEEELSYMLLHGILHLLGYEHEEDEVAAREMFDLQDAIFAKIQKQKLANS